MGYIRKYTYHALERNVKKYISAFQKILQSGRVKIENLNEPVCDYYLGYSGFCKNDIIYINPLFLWYCIRNLAGENFTIQYRIMEEALRQFNYCLANEYVGWHGERVNMKRFFKERVWVESEYGEDADEYEDVPDVSMKYSSEVYSLPEGEYSVTTS